MENTGYIKLFRKLKDKGYYRNSRCVHLWVHLLLSACYEEKEFLWNGELIKIKAGQLLTGRKVLSHILHIPETAIERWLDLLEREHQIGQQKTSKFRIITIHNWAKHQERTSNDEKRTTNGQQTDTYNNNKNEKTSSSNDDLHSQVKTLFNTYTERYKDWISDEKPIFNWGACEKLAKPHLKSLGLDKMKHLLTYYLKHADPKDREFWKKHAYSLQVFLSANTIHVLNTKYGKL